VLKLLRFSGEPEQCLSRSHANRAAHVYRVGACMLYLRKNAGKRDLAGPVDDQPESAFVAIELQQENDCLGEIGVPQFFIGHQNVSHGEPLFGSILRGNAQYGRQNAHHRQFARHCNDCRAFQSTPGLACLPVTMRVPNHAMVLRTSSGILADIVQHKQQEVAELRPRAALLEQQAHARKSRARGFAAALRKVNPAIIAEIKKASPSKGLLQHEFHPALNARAYEEGGAAALSVLTDKQYFQGELHDLEAARSAVELPVLRKDFTIDRLQIFEAAMHGADAVLLIAAILETTELRQFRETAASLGLDSLVEVHNPDELAKAIDSGAEIIGVNNRNLDTFEVSLETSLRLSYLLPSNVIRVSESGIHNRSDIDLLLGAGYSGFLIGEALMKAEKPAAALKLLMQTA